MITITKGSGFQMTFKNEWTISVQFGKGDYCNKRMKGNENNAPIYDCENAEIAIWKGKNGELYDFGMDTVLGWCSADEVAEWISVVRQWK